MNDGGTAILLVQAGGFLHLAQLPAMMMAPRVLCWHEDLARLRPINQRILRVMGLAVILFVQVLGWAAILFSRQMAAAGLGRFLVLFLALFWLWRTWVQIFLYARIWPTGRLARFAHWGMCALFSSKSALFAGAALVG